MSKMPAIYLNVPLKDEKRVKQLGAKFDVEANKWFIQDISNYHNFYPWLPNYALYPSKPSDNKHLSLTKEASRQKKKDEAYLKRKAARQKQQALLSQ